MGKITVLGVHSVTARDPVHLIEIEIDDADTFDFGAITQELSDQPAENWQVAYDEHEIEAGDRSRYAFFFHYLDLDKPLQTSFGPVELTPPSPIPSHLEHIIYEEP